jgi:hypothetical protein
VFAGRGFSINFRGKSDQFMKNIILLLIVIAVVYTSCGKKDAGFFAMAKNNPPPVSSDTITHYYYFNNVIIDSNATDTFHLPSLSQGIIDSGTLTITFRSSIVWLNTWYPLPDYTFPDGSSIVVNRVDEEPGRMVLQALGSTTPAMNYCFYLSASH